MDRKQPPNTHTSRQIISDPSDYESVPVNVRGERVIKP
jgi:hypothetical protein